MKRKVSIALAGLMLFPVLGTFCGCSGDKADLILRVYNWEEYIDEGGEGTFVFDELHELDDKGKPVKDASGNHVHIESDIVDEDYKAWYEETVGIPLSEEGPAILDDFERWYEREYGVKVKVEYSTFGTNEDMYNELLLGNEYDLLCPSDYMIMKLAAEKRLEPYDESFFDPEEKNNYYVRNVSPFIQEKFETNAGLAGKSYTWSEYAAGYMWGTTGFVYNPDAVSEEELKEQDWQVFLASKDNINKKITAKDNVRDTYFAALGVTFQEELIALKAQRERGELSAEDYTKAITEIFNDTTDGTIAKVEPILQKIKENIYSFETDTGKADLVNGNVNLNYAWSGDAVYAMDRAEAENDKFLNYFVPEGGSNLWFDGWVMPKGIQKAQKQAAQAFVNFLSMPQNAMRNSYYIGYTSAISGSETEMLDYCDYLYGYEFDPEEEEEPEETVEYDLSWFFGEEDAVITATREQAERRQLYAQFPPEEVMARCAVMDYYGEEATVRINELWSRIKAETLDGWAIAVICISVLGIALFFVFVKFGSKIDFARRKPKKGYHLVRDEDEPKRP